jgi:methionyl-tRNA formyltransferase
VNYVVAASKLWNPRIADELSAKTGQSFFLITEKSKLTIEALEKIRPAKIFFPHWSHILKSDIYDTYECIMFHMTDLPFGRGGSPLQNLIIRGYESTKISAFRCDGGIDTGSIYLKEPLALTGSANEIYRRANDKILDMIVKILKENPIAQPQAGEPVEFKRRQPNESELPKQSSPKEVYDFIRMLDAEGYPKAFIRSGDLKFEFSEAALDNEVVSAKVRVTNEKL